MKNALLMAISMGVMGSVCANGNASKAELLVHLKNVRSELICVIDQDLPCLFEQMYPKANSELYGFFEFSMKLMGDFYSTTPRLQKIVTEDIVRPEFDVICENVSQTLEQMLIKGGFKVQDPVEISEDIKQELFELFVPIFEKTSQEYFVNIKDIVGTEVTRETIRDIFEEVLNSCIKFPAMLMNDWPLLKLVDAKIAELEAQVS